MKPLDRFISYTAPSSIGDCINWTGIKTKDGYGRFYLKGKLIRAHRWIYEFYKGKIPKPLEIDHLCKNRACVNLNHLEVVTHRENIFRSDINPMVLNSRKTHCIYGHEFTSENTYIRTDGSRKCRICIRRMNSERKKRIRALKRSSRPLATLRLEPKATTGRPCARTW